MGRSKEELQALKDRFKKQNKKAHKRFVTDRQEKEFSKRPSPAKEEAEKKSPGVWAKFKAAAAKRKQKEKEQFNN